MSDWKCVTYLLGCKVVFYVNSASFVVFEQITPGFLMLLIQRKLPVADS